MKDVDRLAKEQRMRSQDLEEKLNDANDRVSTECFLLRVQERSSSYSYPE